MSDPQQAKFQESFGKDLLQQSTVHLNVKQNVIITTEDKVRLCMSDHAERLARRWSWMTPLSLVVTIILVLLTSEFHDFLGVPKATWHALFLLVCLVTLGWLVLAAIGAIRTSTSIDCIVDELKEASGEVSEQLEQSG